MRQELDDYADYVPAYNPAFLARVRERKQAEKAAIARKNAEAYCGARIKGSPPRVNEIINEIAAKHLVPVEALLGKGRTRPLAEARGEIYYTLKATFHWASWSQIGGWLGKDHTTAMHGAAMYAERHNLPPVTNHDIIEKRARYHRSRRAA